MSALEVQAAALSLSTVDRRALATTLLWSLPRDEVIAIHARLTDMMQKDLIALLPPELSIRILSYLDADTLLKCRMVSKTWASLADDQVLWLELCKSNTPPIAPAHTTWHDLTLQRQLLQSRVPTQPTRPGDESFDSDDDNSPRPAATMGNSPPAPRVIPYSQHRVVWERPHGGLPTYQRAVPAPANILAPQGDISAITPIASHLPLPTALPRVNYKHLYLVRRILSRRMTYSRPADLEATGRRQTATWNPRVTILKSETSALNGGLPGHTESIYSLQLFRHHLTITPAGLGEVDDLAYNLRSAWPSTSHQDVFNSPMSSSWPGLGSAGPGRAASPVPAHSVTGRDWLLSASRDKTMRLWQLDCPYPRVVKIFSGGHEGSILTHFVSEVPLRQSQPRAGRAKSTSPVRSPFKSPSSPTGSSPATRLIAVSGGGDGCICLWDIEHGDGTPEKVIQAHSDSVFFVRGDDERIVSCSKDRTIKVFDIRTLEELLVIDGMDSHRAAINTVALTKEFLISASGDRTIRLWDIHTGRLLASTVGHTRGISSIDFEPFPSPLSGWKCTEPGSVLRGTIVTGSSDASIRTFHVVEMPPSAELDEVTFRDMLDSDMDGNPPISPRFVIQPGVEYRALCTCPMPAARPGPNGCMRCFNRGHTELVRSLHIGDEVTLSASYDKTIKMWDRQNGRLIFDFDGCHSGSVFAITGDRTRVVSAGMDVRIAIVDFSEGLDAAFV